MRAAKKPQIIESVLNWTLSNKTRLDPELSVSVHYRLQLDNVYSNIVRLRVNNCFGGKSLLYSCKDTRSHTKPFYCCEGKRNHKKYIQVSNIAQLHILSLFLNVNISSGTPDKGWAAGIRHMFMFEIKMYMIRIGIPSILVSDKAEVLV